MGGEQAKANQYKLVYLQENLCYYQITFDISSLPKFMIQFETVLVLLDTSEDFTCKHLIVAKVC